MDLTNENMPSFIHELYRSFPFYSVAIEDIDGARKINKFYGIAASFGLGVCVYGKENILKTGNEVFLEEAKGNFKVILPVNGTDTVIQTNGGLVDYTLKLIKASSPEIELPSTEEMLGMLANMGLTQIPYEEYMDIEVNQEYGCLFNN